MSDLVFDRTESVEVVKFNRPEIKNALTYEMAREMTRRIRELEYDDGVRAILITGEGDAFCSGADLTGKGGREDAAVSAGMRLMTQVYNRLALSIANIEKPVVAAVNGPAAGAGCNIALACDLILASESARFIQIFSRRGMVVDASGSFFLTRSVGLARAKEIMFTGRPVGADEALEIGMINRVVLAEQLEEEAMELALELSRGPTRAIGMIKKMANRSFESDLATAIELEATYQGIAVSTEDFKEGVLAFFDKREPRFEGR